MSTPELALFFGDSISFGQGVSPHRIWVAQCSDALTREFGNDRVMTANPSINGNTTRMALERMAYDVQAYKPRLLIVQFGLNDANFWMSDLGHPRVSIGGYEANLREIVARGRIFGAETVILHTNHLTDAGGVLEAKISPVAPHSYRQNIAHYNDVVRKVARDTGCVLTDVEAAWEREVKAHGSKHPFLLADGIHLSAEGHDLYFSTVYPTVQAEFARLVAV